MNKAQLIDALAAKTNFAKKDVDTLVENFQTVVMDQLKAGEEVTLAGFGTFEAVDRKGRKGVNPRKPTEAIQIPTVRVPKFRAGKNLKEAVRR
jgi:DNA-binding protein HU-beta